MPQATYVPMNQFDANNVSVDRRQMQVLRDIFAGTPIAINCFEIEIGLLSFGAMSRPAANPRSNTPEIVRQSSHEL